MRLQGAIFDMDGTLLDSMSMWTEFATGLLREFGRTPKPGLDAVLKPMTLRQASEYVRSEYGLAQSVDEIVALSNERINRFYREQVQIKPNVDKFLSILKMEGVWMYVATATDREPAESALRRTGLGQYFRGILTCTEAGAGKEDPRIYEKCLTRLRCRKEDCVVFEDALHALKTAKAAGFRTAGIYDASAEADQPEIQTLADYYIRDYGEFLQSGTL